MLAVSPGPKSKNAEATFLPTYEWFQYLSPRETDVWLCRRRPFAREPRLGLVTAAWFQGASVFCGLVANGHPPNCFVKACATPSC